MAKKVLSIEMGNWWTKVVLAEPYKKSTRIDDMFYFRTPEKAVDDGMIRDRDRFLTALREELFHRGIREKDVIFIINSTKVVTREITIPFVKDKDLPGIVATQAADYFPMDVSGYTITHQKLGEFVDDDKKKQLKLALIAVPDGLLSNYVALAKAGGYNIEAFEYIANSVVSFVKTHYNVNHVVVQLEENATIVSVISGKKLAFQRVVPNGYGNALAAVLEHPVLNVENELEAYHFLTTHNLLYKSPKVGNLNDEDDARRLKALENAYADIREVLSYQIRVTLTALEYYRDQTKKEFFGVMRLVGDGSRIAGISKFFTDEIPLELAEENTLAHVNLPKRISRDDINDVDFTSAVGALIEPLNIKPKEMLEREAKQSTLKVAYLAFAASIAISAALVSMGTVRYWAASQEHDRLTNRIMELDYIQKIYDEQQAAIARATEYISFDLLTYTDNELQSALINSLEEQLPQSVTVTGLEISGSNISLNLISPDKITVAQMLLNLGEIPIIGSVSIPSMTENIDEAGNIQWDYSVVAQYVGAQKLLQDILDAAAGLDTAGGSDSVGGSDAAVGSDSAEGSDAAAGN